MAALLSVHDLVITLPAPAGGAKHVRAVDGVSFELEAGETLALVGESGSGKTLTALAVLGLVPAPLTVTAGRIFFREQNLLRIDASALRALRGRALAMIFQDPLGALHPLLTIGHQLVEVLAAHEPAPRREARARAAAALGEVGLPAPERMLARFPHELSGGQRQRVMIAMALLLRPAVLFADEPTTALDVTLQAQVLELLASLRERHGSALVLITHDLGLVAGQAERVLVLYAGRAVETAPTRALFARALHPYTRGLLASIPRLDAAAAGAPLPTIPGQPPDLLDRPSGCAFHPRCTFAVEPCRTSVPTLDEVRGAPGRRSACFEVRALLGGQR